jgi:hypothetical protein
MSTRCNRLRLAAFLLVAAAGSSGFLLAGLGCGTLDAPRNDSPPGQPLRPTPPEEPTFDTPEVGTVDADEQVLNEFSWADFIALNWPAADGKRGEPHARKTFGDEAAAVVWETWKSLDELFPEDPVATPPTKWDQYEANLSLWTPGPDNKPRRHSLKDYLEKRSPAGVKVLYRVSRLGEVNLPSTQVFPRGPLIAQKGTYVRFETRVNRTAYEFMTQEDHKYYLKANLPAKLVFPEKSIHVKAAWMELPEDEAVRKRFYRTTATTVVDWTSDGKPVLADLVVGLVGLHIVHKTPKRPDWIWSTFEHVDNLLAEHGPGTPPASFSTKAPPEAAMPNQPEPPALKARTPYPKPTDRTPVEVARLNPIHATTDEVNRRYQNHPRIKGTVWQNYKLVATQWPKLGQPTKPPDGNPANRLPPNLANVTMETYFQSLSCLACHASAKPSEFVFYPGVRAFAP